MKLFLLIGQSNMAGRGKVEQQDQVENPKIQMLTKDLKWVPARDPLHFDKPIAGVGLGSQFARTVWQADTNATIGLIPCAVGGTTLDQWKPGGALYKAAVARTQEAQKHGQLAAILWHQGEGDSGNPQLIATYPSRCAQRGAARGGETNAAFRAGELRGAGQQTTALQFRRSAHARPTLRRRVFENGEALSHPTATL
jgi:hypothetical protein